MKTLNIDSIDIQKEKVTLQKNFEELMINYDLLKIDNYLSIDNYQVKNAQFFKLEKNLSKNASSYFLLTNKIERLLEILIKKYNILNSQLEKIKKENTKLHYRYEELMSFNDASTQMKTDAMFNYSKNNIQIFNYLIGTIFCFYIIHKI
jgi:hypothetical protein